VVCTTITFGKQRDALDRKEVSPKQPVTETDSRALRGGFGFPSVNSHRSNGKPVSGAFLDPLGQCHTPDVSHLASVSIL
jgi:hypothetical protein